MATEQEIGTLLGSRNRIKILGLLSKNGPTNISSIVDMLGLNYTSALRHLELLHKNGLLREKRYGKIRVYEPCFSMLELSFVDEEGLIFEITKFPEEEEIILGYPPINEKPYKPKDKTEYPLSVGDILKNKVKNRDENQCVLCGKTEEDCLKEKNQYLVTHHVDEIKTNNFMDNLVTLCTSCHIKIHKKCNREELKTRIKEYPLSV